MCYTHPHTHTHARTTTSVCVRVGVCGAQIKPGICTCLFMFSLEYCRKKMEYQNYSQWQIQDFPNRVLANFSKECMEMKIVCDFPAFFLPFELDDGFVKLMVGFLKYKKPSVAEKTT